MCDGGGIGELLATLASWLPTLWARGRLVDRLGQSNRTRRTVDDLAAVALAPETAGCRWQFLAPSRQKMLPRGII